MLSYTLPGVPMMYTGQEVGFNHAFEFFEADSITPSYTANEFTTFYEVLNSLKHKNRALDARVPATFHKNADKDILVFSREKGDNRVMVIANLSNESRKLKLGQEAALLDGLADCFTGVVGPLPETLRPWQYIVLTK